MGKYTLTFSALTMGLLNYMVFCKSSQRTLATWKISSVEPPTLTFRGFFEAYIQRGDLELESTFVGKSKEHTDEVDSDLLISEVCIAFGSFAKFYAQEMGHPEETESKQIFKVCNI